MATPRAPDADKRSTLEQLRHGRPFARECWRTAVERTDLPVAIDATAGRGSDTITLGHLVGGEGVVYAMDIQATAVDETRARYMEERERGVAMGELRLYERSHEELDFLALSKRSVACVVYNLGWYPGQAADRSIITTAACTVASLRAAEELVAVHGIIFVTAYRGHSGGQEEEDAVTEWARGLTVGEWNVMNVGYPNRAKAPTMVICERIAES